MDKYQIELLSDAIYKITELEGTLLMVKPDDYPPSEWVTYKEKTSEIQKMRLYLEQLYDNLAEL